MDRGVSSMSATTPRLLDHLARERSFYDSSCAHLGSLVSDLTGEMTARVPDVDLSAPWRRTGFSYYSLTRRGHEYADIVREIHWKSSHLVRKASDEPDLGDRFRSHGDLVLDVNALAQGADHLELGVTLVSPDEHLLAYSVDRTGDEVYELRFRDLRTGTDLDEVVPRTYYGGAWSADSQWFFYTVHDQAYRPHQVWRHRVGSPAADDVLVLEEPDERFDFHLRATRSGSVIRNSARSSVSCTRRRRRASTSSARSRSAGSRSSRWAAFPPGAAQASNTRAPSPGASASATSCALPSCTDTTPSSKPGSAATGTGVSRRNPSRQAGSGVASMPASSRRAW